ncbi:MAG TPA: Asp-tRNA(Asn)/Glu-tRNA(Gln) amidotransferase subunit GatA [Candidatus Polarisedimenticolia bacterium]|nr:Asp-tRNA(Asn)/Glu-tRNA(Gln) amidotransferase subunit GatA [Candidatus Polarisedimenticolia bacterium]
MSGLTGRTIGEIRSLVASGEASAVEVCRAHLERARALEPRLKAFRILLEEEALREAARVDRERAEGRTPGPLAGVPIAVKDVLCARGAPATCGSRILQNHVPIYDATCVARLRGAGAVLLGKTNMDEFAMGSSTENSAFEKTSNPWAPDRVPGGSSGGSAAAVAAREVPAALGTDTGGSIRQPAAFCGVPGMKPTYGRVSRYGLVAFASSLDQAGPFGRTVEDVARVLQVIAGHDPHDSTSADVDVPDYLAGLRRGASGLRLGVPAEYFKGGMDKEVDASVRSALHLAEGLGARLEEISLPHTEYAIPTYYIIATAEASSNLARYDGVRYGHRAPGARQLGPLYVRTRTEGFGAEVKRRIMLGTYVLSSGYYDAYYLKGQKVRTLIRRDFERAFEKVDAILTPTTPTPAFRFGDKTDDPLAMYLSDIYTVTINLAGLPGISIPCGLTRERLPIGLQIIGRRFDEETVLRLAAALEGELKFQRHVPPLEGNP